jgi:hypothetical protein
MADDLLLANYPRQAVVRDRNASALLAWAAYETAQAIPPTKPDEEFVRERLVGERIPLQTANYVERTLSFFQQDPTVQTNIRQFLSQWNDEATEVQLSAQNNSIITAFMPRFAAADVSDADVQAWYTANGFA